MTIRGGAYYSKNEFKIINNNYILMEITLGMPNYFK